MAAGGGFIMETRNLYRCRSRETQTVVWLPAPLESVLRRYDNKAVSALPSDPNEQRKLSIRLGYDSFEFLVATTWTLARQFTRITNGILFPQRPLPSALQPFDLQLERGLARNFLSICVLVGNFFTNISRRWMASSGLCPGQTAPDHIDLLQLPRLQQQFLAARAGEEDVDRRINALIADLAVEHHLHVARCP